MKQVHWFEEYRNCGCISHSFKSRKGLHGYCPIHGGDATVQYRQTDDGKEIETTPFRVNSPHGESKVTTQ